MEPPNRPAPLTRTLQPRKPGAGQTQKDGRRLPPIMPAKLRGTPGLRSAAGPTQLEPLADLSNSMARMEVTSQADDQTRAVGYDVAP